MTTPADMSLQKQLYGIGIFEEEIVLSDFTSGAEQRHVVTPEQLQGFFRSDIVFRPFPGLLWMKSNGSSETYLISFPAGPRTILYRKGGKGKVSAIPLRLPAMVVQATLDASTRRIGTIRMWGHAGKQITSDTALYELPLPNLSNESLCLGGTERASGVDVRGAVEKTIFDTPFNHHNHLVGSERIPFQAYVKKYRGACPVKTLKRIGRGRQILEARP